VAAGLGEEVLPLVLNLLDARLADRGAALFR
jgi:hypothetical protein